MDNRTNARSCAFWLISVDSSTWMLNIPLPLIDEITVSSMSEDISAIRLLMVLSDNGTLLRSFTNLSPNRVETIALHAGSTTFSASVCGLQFYDYLCDQIACFFIFCRCRACTKLFDHSSLFLFFIKKGFKVIL